MDQSDYLPPHQVDTTSSRLLARLREKDSDAWSTFVRIYGPVVRYWIRRSELNQADLADVFQEVFLAVTRNIGAYIREPGKAKFRAWLKTIALNKVHDHFRQQGRRPQTYGGSTAMLRLSQLEATTTSGDDEDEIRSLAHSEDAFLVQRTLQIVKCEFHENTWKAFYRTAVDGITSQEAAAELGITALAARKAKSRVIQRLKEALSGVLRGS